MYAITGMEEYLNKIIQGDCLEVMPQLPSHCVDMVLCDLPYGTTQNKWDSVIDLSQLWAEYKRLLRPGGTVVLTAQGLFTARLIMSNETWFKYKIVWVKSKATNFLNAKRQPLRKHEDICVFCAGQTTYNPQMMEGASYDKGVRKDQLTGSYGDFKPRHVKSNGERYPNDILFMDDHDDCVYFKTAESEGTVYHPTQKPVELGRYLIRTFSNPGDVVLDNACGSGSFLVAAKMEGRKFIGIEKNQDVMLHKKTSTDYLEICRYRLGKVADTDDIQLNKGVNFVQTELHFTY